MFAIPDSMGSEMARKCVYCKADIDPSYSHKSVCRECNTRKSTDYYYKVVRPNIPGIEDYDRAKKALAEARANGEKTYLSGKPCPKGHVGERYVSSQCCCKCHADRKISRRPNHERALTKKHNALRREIARNLGKTRFDGVLECVNGHIGPRLVSTGQCCQCLKERSKKQSRTTPRPRVDQVSRINAKRRSRVGRARNRSYYKNVLSKSDRYKMTAFMRQSLRRCLIAKNGQRTFDILGYDQSKLMERLEMNFKEGMSWDNYGEWHIDHVKPISRFLSQGVSDPKIINALSNLRPMWGSENLSKGSTFA